MNVREDKVSWPCEILVNGEYVRTDTMYHVPDERNFDEGVSLGDNYNGRLSVIHYGVRAAGKYYIVRGWWFKQYDNPDSMSGPYKNKKEMVANLYVLMRLHGWKGARCAEHSS